MAGKEAGATVEVAEASSTGGWGGAVLPGNEDLSGAVATEEVAAEEPVTTGTEEVEPEAKTEETPEAVEATEPEEKKVEEVAPKLWAERYKTPEDLEIAYKHSSEEGKRLSVKIKEQAQTYEKQVGELSDKVAELTILAEVGPEMKEPTDEELEAMGPVKATRLLQKISDRKNALGQLKAKAEARKKEEASEQAALSNHIKQVAKEMATRTDQFPDFETLKPAMDSLIDMEPGLTGLPYTPQILYLAAQGQRYLKNLGEVKGKTKASEDAAKAKAKAAITGAGAAGANGGGGKKPDSAKKVGSEDDEYNDKFIAAANKRAIAW